VALGSYVKMLMSSHAATEVLMYKIEHATKGVLIYSHPTIQYQSPQLPTFPTLPPCTSPEP